MFLGLRGLPPHPWSLLTMVKTIFRHGVRDEVLGGNGSISGSPVGMLLLQLAGLGAYREVVLLVRVRRLDESERMGAELPLFSCLSQTRRV